MLGLKRGFYSVVVIIIIKDFKDKLQKNYHHAWFSFGGWRRMMMTTRK